MVGSPNFAETHSSSRALIRHIFYPKAALAEGQPRVLEALAEVSGHEVRRLAPRAELEVHQRAHALAAAQRRHKSFGKMGSFCLGDSHPLLRLKGLPIYFPVLKSYK